MTSSWLTLTVAAIGMSSLSATLSAQTPDPGRRATIAVLYFTNSALTRHQEYQPLSKGIADMLITELSASPALQVVERDRLQDLLEEQDLSGSSRVDQETAVKLGKILGVRHLLMGGFIIDPRENMRLDLRAVNVETSQVEYVETVSGKAEDILTLVTRLGAKVNQRLRLPPLPERARPAASKTPRSAQLRAVMLLSRALDAQDAGNPGAAIALYRQALDIYPEYERARVLLASLSGQPAQPPN